jgi:class 3 adenylate cyclase
MGDGVLVYFGYPHAQEKDAERAVHAGLAILDTLPALNRRFARVDGIRLAVRIASRPGSSWSAGPRSATHRAPEITSTSAFLRP